MFTSSITRLAGLLLLGHAAVDLSGEPTWATAARVGGMLVADTAALALGELIAQRGQQRPGSEPTQRGRHRG